MCSSKDSIGKMPIDLVAGGRVKLSDGFERRGVILNFPVDAVDDGHDIAVYINFPSGIQLDPSTSPTPQIVGCFGAIDLRLRPGSRDAKRPSQTNNYSPINSRPIKNRRISLVPAPIS